MVLLSMVREWLGFRHPGDCRAHRVGVEPRRSVGGPRRRRRSTPVTDHDVRGEQDRCRPPATVGVERRGGAVEGDDPGRGDDAHQRPRRRCTISGRTASTAERMAPANAGRPASTDRLSGRPRPKWSRRSPRAARPRNGRPRISRRVRRLRGWRGRGGGSRPDRGRRLAEPTERKVHDLSAGDPVAASTTTTPAPGPTAKRSSMSSWPTKRRITAAAETTLMSRPAAISGRRRRPGRPPAHEDLHRVGRSAGARGPPGVEAAWRSWRVLHVEFEEVRGAADARVVAPHQLLDAERRLVPGQPRPARM